MNPGRSLVTGAIFGIALGSVALATFGWWALPLVLVFTLAGILVGERL